VVFIVRIYHDAQSSEFQILELQWAMKP